MSDSLFDDESIPFIILANPIGQYSLWPDPLPRPRGWSQVYGPCPASNACSGCRATGAHFSLPPNSPGSRAPHEPTPHSPHTGPRHPARAL